MNKKILLLLALVPTIASAADITLTDPSKIEDANAIEKAMGVVSARVTQCIEKKLAVPEKCFCLYPAEVEEVKNKYEIAIKKNPEWIGKLVYFTIPGDTMGHNLNFVGLKRQAEMKCEK
jgi:hypothetical protein